MLTLNRAGWIHCLAGDIQLGTASPAITIPKIGGFKFTGEGYGIANTPPPGGYSLPATRFLAGAANQTLFKAPGDNPLQHFKFQDFSLHANGFSGLTGMDLSASSEATTNGSVIRDVHVEGNPKGFNYCLNLDGNEDLTLNGVSCGQYTIPAPLDTGADVHWNAPAGNIRAINCDLFGNRGIIGQAQSWHLFGNTLQSLVLLGNAGNLQAITALDNYWNVNTGGQIPMINTAGYTLQELAIIGGTVSIVNGSVNLLGVGGGAGIESLILENFNLQTGATNVNLTDDSTKIGFLRNTVRNVKVTGSALASVAPYTLDANNYLIAPAASGVLTAGASPYTIPAQGFAYLFELEALNGGTAITLDGVTMPTTAHIPILVQPGHTLILTWATTAPTYKRIYLNS